MSKVHMIFLFLLSGAVQLSHTDQSLPKIYGNVFKFYNGKLVDIYQVSKKGLSDTDQNNFNVWITDPSNQTIVRWHIRPDQTCDTYDFVFVSDITVTITEEDLNQISPEPIRRGETDIWGLLDNFIEKHDQKYVV